jgi:hypothetical protein
MGSWYQRNLEGGNGKASRGPIWRRPPLFNASASRSLPSPANQFVLPCWEQPSLQ